MSELSPPTWKYTKKPWEGVWGATSPYNWADEITEKWRVPDKVELHDCTFRDGEQCTIGVPLNKQDYIDIACAMSDWGISRYEFMPATSKENAEAAKELNKMGLKAEMWGFCRSMVEDIKAAIDCGMKGVEIEMSPRGYLTGAGTWKPEQMVKLQLDACKMAKDAGLRVSNFLMLSVMTPFEEIKAFTEKVSEYSEAYCCVDTTGTLTPEGTAFFTDKVRTIRPDLKLESHAHNMNNIGVANAITAFAHGCSVLHGEMLGFTLPPLQEVAINLLQMYGVDPGIKWEKTKEVCELIAERTHNWISPGRQYIGNRIGYHQAGIGHSPRLRQLKEMEERLQRGEKVEPPREMRGMSRVLGLGAVKETLGKQSGRGTMNLKLWSMGIPEVTSEQAAAILEKVKEKVVREKLYSVSDEDFIKFYDEVVGNPAPPPEKRKVPEVVKRGLSGLVWL